MRFLIGCLGIFNVGFLAQRDSFKLAVLVTGIAHLRQKVFPLVAWRQRAVREDAAHAHYASSKEEKNIEHFGIPSVLTLFFFHWLCWSLLESNALWRKAEWSPGLKHSVMSLSERRWLLVELSSLQEVQVLLMTPIHTRKTCKSLALLIS